MCTHLLSWISRYLPLTHRSSVINCYSNLISKVNLVRVRILENFQSRYFILRIIKRYMKMRPKKYIKYMYLVQLWVKPFKFISIEINEAKSEIKQNSLGWLLSLFVCFFSSRSFFIFVHCLKIRQHLIRFGHSQLVTDCVFCIWVWNENE